MKVIISESKLEDLKKIFYNKWDKQGYAIYDSKMDKVFNVKKYIDDDPGLNKTGHYITPDKLIRLWVTDWNKKHGITNLSILDEFGMELYVGTYSNYYDSTKPGKFTYKDNDNYLEFEINELRLDDEILILYYLNFNLNNAIIDGENVGEVLRAIDDDDDDDWNETVEHYREFAIGLVYDYMTKNYVNKMSGDIDIEIEYVDSLFEN
jgi:hypothetical protein